MVTRNFVPPTFSITDLQGELSLALSSLFCLDVDGLPKKFSAERLAKFVQDGKIWIDRKRLFRIILTIAWEDEEGRRKLPISLLLDGLIQAVESLEVRPLYHGMS